MNRRLFVGAGVSSIAVTTHAFAQTPEPVPAIEAVDLRAREIAGMLENVSPLTLLEALETAPISGSGSESLTPIPWQDYGDTDLYNSLGGVFITHTGTDLNDPDTEGVGGYIVYESAEIAYHELIRKLGALYDSPSSTTSAGGANHWIIESDDLEISVGRIGYVLILGLISEYPNVILDLVGHLYDVATSVS